MKLKLKKLCQALIVSVAVFVVFALSIDKVKHSATEIERVYVSLEELQDGATPTKHTSESSATIAMDVSVSSSSSHEVFGEPMVLSLSYWEQTGNALNSLFNLQCWASSVNIAKVLEPSIVSFRSHSTFQFQPSESMTFQDLFNISRWNKMSIKQGYSMIAPMKYFVTDAAKEVVYVHIKYEFSPVSCVTLPKKLQDYLPKNGFRLVKSVCIDFTDSKKHFMSEAEFEGLIFEGVSRDVTLIFNEWRGIRDFERVALKGQTCRACLKNMTSVAFSYHQPPALTYVPYKSTSPVIVSQRILRYINRFVSEHLSGEKYIAIMLRTEKIKHPKMSGSLEKNSCVVGILSDWKSMAKHNNITKTLLFSDTGKHGSTGWLKEGTARRFVQHIQDAVHVYIAPDKINSVLERITGSVNSVQVALLHQQLVARATCVVMVGGGTFQGQTLNHYAHLHRGHECYSVKMGECARHSYMTAIHGQELPN